MQVRVHYNVNQSWTSEKLSLNESKSPREGIAWVLDLLAFDRMKTYATHIDYVMLGLLYPYANKCLFKIPIF